MVLKYSMGLGDRYITTCAEVMATQGKQLVLLSYSPMESRLQGF
jgi:hypothetical protein